VRLYAAIGRSAGADGEWSFPFGLLPLRGYAGAVARLERHRQAVALTRFHIIGDTSSGDSVGDLTHKLKIGTAFCNSGGHVHAGGRVGRVTP
jgi:hypothetical protein